MPGPTSRPRSPGSGCRGSAGARQRGGRRGRRRPGSGPCASGGRRCRCGRRPSSREGHPQGEGGVAGQAGGTLRRSGDARSASRRRSPAAPPWRSRRRRSSPARRGRVRRRSGRPRARGGSRRSAESARPGCRRRRAPAPSTTRCRTAAGRWCRCRAANPRCWRRRPTRPRRTGGGATRRLAVDDRVVGRGMAVPALDDELRDDALGPERHHPLGRLAAEAALAARQDVGRGRADDGDDGDGTAERGAEPGQSWGARRAA